jgi:hypothetical protein
MIENTSEISHQAFNLTKSTSENKSQNIDKNQIAEKNEKTDHPILG